LGFSILLWQQSEISNQTILPVLACLLGTACGFFYARFKGIIASSIYIV